MSNQPALEDFPFVTYDKLRYNDTDRQGHVNNAIFSTYLETGRVEIFYQDPEVMLDGCEFVIARVTLDFLGEIRWPGEIKVASAPARSTWNRRCSRTGSVSPGRRPSLSRSTRKPGNPTP